MHDMTCGVPASLESCNYKFLRTNHCGMGDIVSFNVQGQLCNTKEEIIFRPVSLGMMLSL